MVLVQLSPLATRSVDHSLPRAFTQDIHSSRDSKPRPVRYMHMPRSRGPERLHGFSWSWVFVGVMFTLLTLDSVMAVYHSREDAAVVAFVATSYADLVLLFCSLWLYNRTAAGSAWRNRLKAAVWTLTTLLTFCFAYVVMGTAGLTLPVALLVWFVAAATGIGAFSAFFEQGRINPTPDETMPLSPV